MLNQIKTLLLLFMFFQALRVPAQTTSCAVSTFQKAYGTPERNDLAMDIVETPDHGFITGGWGADNGDCFLMKVDSKGNPVWTRQVADAGRNRGFMKRFLRLKDGNYLAMGRAYRPDFLDSWLIKFDENGNVLWNKEITYPTGISNDPHGVCETADGGIVVCGNYAPYANAGGSFVAKLSASGDMVWSKVHLGDFGLASLLEKSGVLFLVGRSSTNTDGIVVKMRTTDGEALGANVMHIDNKLTAFRSIEEKNGRFYINGYNTDNQGFDGLHQVIVITDTFLVVQQVHKFNFDFKEEWEIPAMTATPDGGFVAAECDERNADLLLFKVSYEGTIQWKRKYARPGDQRVYNIKTTADNGIVGVGTSNNFGYYYNYFNDVYLFKTDSAGLSPDCTVSDPTASIVHPDYINAGTFFDYTPVDFPVIPINSLNRSVSIPVLKFCESTTGISCNAVTIAGDAQVCFAADAFLYKAIRNKECNSPVNWQVDSSFASVISRSDSVVALKFKGDGSTRLIATVQNGCQQAVDTLIVQSYSSARTLNLGPDLALCPGNTIVLNARKGFASYQWQGGSADSTYTVTQPGLYHVTVTDACGGTFRDSVRISAALPISFDAGPDRVKCNGDTVHLSAPDGFLSYTWSNDYNLSSPAAQNVVANPLVDTAYYIKAEKTPGCYAYDTVRITVHTSPSIDLGADKNFCFGDSAVANAGGGFQSYAWSSGQTMQQVVLKSAGSYSLIATTVEGCKSYDTVRVIDVYPLPQPRLERNISLCEGASKTLEAGNFTAYLWSTGEHSSSIAVSAIGNYFVTVTDRHRCSSSDTTSVVAIHSLPAGFLPPDTTMCSYETLEIMPNGAYNSYLWSTGGNASSFTVSQPGLYWLQVQDNNHCTGKDTVNVFSRDCMSGFFVPTAFTPNGDAKNDVFQPKLFGSVKKYVFTVYNRWGQVVFQTNKPAKGWDGKVAGVAQESSVFVWTCTYQFEGGVQKAEKGTVTLVR